MGPGQRTCSSFSNSACCASSSCCLAAISCSNWDCRLDQVKPGASAGVGVVVRLASRAGGWWSSVAVFFACERLGRGASDFSLRKREMLFAVSLGVGRI